MDVTNTNSANVATSVGTLVDNAQQQQPPVAKSEKQPQEQKNSTEVKLSEQAQQLSRTETSAKETVAPPSPQPVESERRGVRVNTHA